jgi:hypothetical protein
VAGGIGHLGDVRGLRGAVHSWRDGGVEQARRLEGRRARGIARTFGRYASRFERLSRTRGVPGY